MRSTLAPLLLAVSLVSSTANAARTIYTNTRYVEAVKLAPDGVTAWVGTRGGLEEYDLATMARRQLYTTEDGLPSNWVRRIEIGDGAIWVWTNDTQGDATHQQLCAFANGEFGCEPVIEKPAIEPDSHDRRIDGARVTATTDTTFGELVGTSSAGVYLIDDGEPVAITPQNQICSNHVVSVAEWQGKRWFGTFDEGLCSLQDNAEFVAIEGAFRMVNKLLVAKDALWVASSEGLFRSTDGVAFERVGGDTIKDAVSDLAFDARRNQVLATTNAALWRIDPASVARPRAMWRPGGTRSLQGVAAKDGTIWLASEDRGAMKLTGLGKRQKLEIWDRASGLPSSWATDVTIGSDGTAYVATLRSGLAAIGHDGPHALTGLPDPWLLAVAEGRNGSLLVGTQGGAARIEKKGRVDFLGPVPNPNVHALYDTKENNGTFVGTEGGTLFLD